MTLLGWGLCGAHLCIGRDGKHVCYVSVYIYIRSYACVGVKWIVIFPLTVAWPRYTTPRYRLTASSQFHHRFVIAPPFTNFRAEDKDKLSETRYLPYIPPAYVADTVSFFKDKNKVDNLLALIFGPQNSTDSYEDRVEYQKRFELYQFLKQVWRGA